MVKHLNLITYPRSGSNFLYTNILSMSNNTVTIDKYHGLFKINKAGPVLTIIRDPFDSIVSDVSNVMLKGLPILNAPVWPTRDINNIDELIEIKIKQYSDFYKIILLAKNLYVIKFEDLIEHPDKVLKRIGKKFDIDLNEGIIEYKDVNVKNQEFKHTSVDNEMYLEIKELVKEFDLTSCYSDYNAVKNLI